MLASEALSDWLADLRLARRSQCTLKTYEGSVRHYIRAAGDDLDGITKKSVRSWLIQMADDGLKPATQEIRYTVMKLFCDWLVSEEIIPANPVHGLPHPVVKPTPVQPYTDDEIAALLGACKGYGFFELRDAAVMRLLLCTGMRRSECAGITLDRIDFNAGHDGVIMVLGKGRGGGRRWRDGPPDSRRMVRLPHDARCTKARAQENALAEFDRLQEVRASRR